MQSSLCRALVGVACSCVFSGLAAAQTPSTPEGPGEMITDRAEFSMTTEVVGRGVFQLETGLLRDRTEDADGSTRMFHLPSPLVRFGLTDRLEIRAGGDGWLMSRHRGLTAIESASGTTDGNVGIKWKVLKQSRFLPDVAISPSLSIPYGKDQFTSGGYDPSFRAAVGKDLKAGFHFSGNIGGGRTTILSDHKTWSTYSMCLEHRLWKTAVGYGEAYRLIRPASLGGNESVFNTGLFQAIGKNAQVDVELGHSFAGATPYSFVGVGFAVRMPSLMGMLRN